MAPKVPVGELTEKEKAILGYAWKCFDSEPKIDFDKLAGLGGYSNPRSAQNILAIAKKKLKTFTDGNADGNGEQSAASPSKTSPTKKNTPATPKGKKRNTKDVNGDEDEVELQTPKKAKKTPTKSPAKSATKKGKSVKDEDEDEEVKEEKEVMDKALQAEDDDDVI